MSIARLVGDLHYDDQYGIKLTDRALAAVGADDLKWPPKHPPMGTEMI